MYPANKAHHLNYERLRELLGFDTYDHVKAGHKKWVESCLAKRYNSRDEKWSGSIAVGSKSFVDNVKSLMGVLAQGRKSIEAGELYQLREAKISYGDHFGAKKSEIELENACIWE